MIHSAIGRLTLLAILCSLNQAVGEIVYYITTNSTDLCTVQQCLNLSQFADNSSHFLHSNTTLVFLPGRHYLSKVNLTLSNVDNFAMKSENSTAQIKCMNDSHIHFRQSQCIHITNLEFIGCGGNQVKHIENIVIKDTKFRGQENSGTALELIETTAQIVNSIYMSNRNGSYRQCIVFYPEDGCYTSGFIGGAIIATNSTIDISQSKFEDNRADFGGAIFAENNSIITMNSNILTNNFANWHEGNGGMILLKNSASTINGSTFQNNTANEGGALSSFYSTITITASMFQNNTPGHIGAGGALWSYNSTITIKASMLQSYIARYDAYGGVLMSFYSTITINASIFQNNAALEGGALMSEYSIIMINANMFQSNTAGFGGVLSFYKDTVTIEASEFDSNSATTWGGVLSSINSTITICGSNFTENNSPTGAVIYAYGGTKVQYCNYLLIDNNSANDNSVVYLFDSEFKGCDSGNIIMFSNNLGSLMAFNSNITFNGYAIFVNNQPPQTSSEEGGAITLFQSNIFFDGKCNLEHNHAENGGAIHSTESKLFVNGNVTIAHNTATGNGGGVYLLTSELNCQQKSTFVLFKNIATINGGGLHAISSSIKATVIVEDDYNNTHRYIGTRVNFTNNAAKLGGGLSLEANAKVYILKYNYFDTVFKTAIFTGNSADYGGAVYVDDDTNSGTCASDPKIECFFQVLAIYNVYGTHMTESMCFSQNSADISGSTLYGGLLDRCAVSQFAEVHVKYLDDILRGGGIAYFRNVSIAPNMSISSRPVRICVCTNSILDCTNHSRVDVKKGEAFNVSLVAVDQIGQPVNATIQTFLSSAESGLAEGQLAKNITAKCTSLTFNVVSLHNLETLTLYALDGPCKNADLSSTTVEVYFLPCSCLIGLQVNSRMNKTNCTCECHHNISQYMKHCDSHTGSLIKQPQSRAWISYINDTGYLVYLNCPFDYCLLNSSDYEVNFNEPNGSGADAQCAFNRSSLLCGSCQPGLSLSLGSSHCLQCPSYWPALLTVITIATLLAGIALVILLLVLNMTVAVGTLNGLLFYANVVYANKSILLPFKETTFITVFISWLNLEPGIDTCYFPGMDSFIKTWLQLAFPAYIIFLVILVIIISSYSTKFSNLIGKMNPVATLATLILLSYAKLLEICFKSLSVGILSYPDGSSEMRWLPDATVNYLSGKHIPLFIAAVLILLVGLVYTALLFSWQCILRLPKLQIFNWSRNPKIQTFIETYNTPYTPKHRYWTGLMLIARIILYLIAAANVSNDPTVSLLSISFVVGLTAFFQGFIGNRVYRKWPIDLLETFFHLNIFIFAIFTWYSLGYNKESIHQEAVAYTSVTITLIVLLFIMLYHMYTYTTVFSKIKKTKLGGAIDKLFTDTNPKPALRLRRYSPPPDDDIHRFDELLDELDCPVKTDDYNTIPLISSVRVQPMYSVVEVHQPCHLAPRPPEGHNAQENAS